MKKKDFITDAEVEREIEILRDNDYVQLSKAVERAKYRRRQYLYQLRWHEKRGKELAKKGYDVTDFNEDEQ